MMIYLHPHPSQHEYVLYHEFSSTITIHYVLQLNYHYPIIVSDAMIIDLTSVPTSIYHQYVSYSITYH